MSLLRRGLRTYLSMLNIRSSFTDPGTITITNSTTLISTLKRWLLPKTLWLREGLGGAVLIVTRYQTHRCCLLQQGLHPLVCGSFRWPPSVCLLQNSLAERGVGGGCADSDSLSDSSLLLAATGFASSCLWELSLARFLPPCPPNTFPPGNFGLF